MPMETSPSKLRLLAGTLRVEADQLDAAAESLEAALSVMTSRTNAGMIAESTISTGLPSTALEDAKGNSSHPNGQLYRIPWGKQAAELDDEFIEGLFWIEDQINLAPEFLVPCMKFESNLNPKARNPASSASGLIQFMSATAIQLGTTIEKIRAMSAMEQLGLVHRYFKAIKTDWSKATLCDVYLAILYPKAIGLPETAQVFIKGSSQYAVNAGLDTNHDGYVSKAEICSRLQKVAIEGAGPNLLQVIRK